MKTLILLTLLWSFNTFASDKSPTDKQINCDGVEVTWDKETGYSAKKGGVELINPNKMVCTIRIACDAMTFNEDGTPAMPVADLTASQSLACKEAWMAVESNNMVYEGKWNGELPDATDRYY